MANDNSVTIIGNVTREPDLRFTPGGQPKAEFGLAVNRSWIDRASNERREQTSFFNVVCWGQLGENVAASLHKGARVIVSGRLEQRSYETQTGEKRERVEVIADEVGPSLRWATAQIEKNDRRSGDGGGGYGGNAGGGSRAPQGGGGYGYDESEEPF
jgi:single-strand DNA-binding protein